MLQWENTMPNDLKLYLGVIAPAAISTSTTAKTGTSTETVTISPQTYTAARGQFVDRIIKNKDVREYVSSDGHVLFLYSFINNSKLLIAGNEDALIEILARLEKQAFVR
jgi:hypothetical protein